MELFLRRESNLDRPTCWPKPPPGPRPPDSRPSGPIKKGRIDRFIEKYLKTKKPKPNPLLLVPVELILLVANLLDENSAIQLFSSNKHFLRMRCKHHIRSFVDIRWWNPSFGIPHKIIWFPQIELYLKALRLTSKTVYVKPDDHFKAPLELPRIRRKYIKVTKDSVIWTLQDMKHRLDAPAIITKEGTRIWYLWDKIHNQDGPAIELQNGDRYWYQCGVPHRNEGPAITLDNCRYMAWYRNGKPHRIGGPAIIDYDISYWYQNGKLSCHTGPAVYNHNYYEWWLHGLRYTSRRFRRLHPRQTCEVDIYA